MSVETLLEKEFPQDDDLVYLNHAAVSPWPLRTSESVSQFAKENVTFGAKNYPQWMKRETALRERLARIINAASTNEIALLKSTSEALSVVAYGIDWQAGDNIVFAKEEFPSNRIVWESLESKGVEVRKVSIAESTSPEATLIEHMDASTRLLATSSVHYADGLQMDLKALSQACKQYDALFCVDAIQSIGAHPIDVQAIDADFMMADGHKWMMGPEGLAVFYCKQRHQDALTLHQYGWHMAKMDSYVSQEWQIKNTAERFECGSPNMLGIFALESSLSLIEEVGIEEIWNRIQANVAYCQNALSHIKGIHFHQNSERPSGILNFTVEGVDSETLYRALMAKSVVCANRGKGVRFSPHFYTSQPTLDRGAKITQDVINALIGH